MIYVKLHQSEHSEILAVCDEELIGKLSQKKIKRLKFQKNSFKENC